MTGATCRIRDCVRLPGRLGFCPGHLARLVDTDRWVPLAPGDDPACGLCGAPVRVVRRLDDTRTEHWTLDADAAPDGRCWVVDGGFRVVSLGIADQLRADGVPLYRTHASACQPLAEIRAAQ